jgi:outer membrane lipoprotein SlyB
MMTMKLGAVLAAAALATGCATHQQTGMLVGAMVGGVAGAAIGSGTGAIAGGVIGTLGGALVGGAVGKHMDKHDHSMVVKSVETNTTQSWTSAKGVQMTSEVKEVGADKKEVTVTAGDKVETTTVVKKQGKWVRE